METCSLFFVPENFPLRVRHLINPVDRHSYSGLLLYLYSSLLCSVSYVAVEGAVAAVRFSLDCTCGLSLLEIT